MQTISHYGLIPSRETAKKLGIDSTSRGGVALVLFAFAAIWLFNPARAQADPCSAISARPAKDGTSSIPAATKTALANAWRNPNGAQHLLTALNLLTRGHEEPAQLNKKIVDELRTADPGHEELYTVAMGLPDKSGQPQVQGLPNILDYLAKANILNLDNTTDSDALSACTQWILLGAQDRPSLQTIVRVYDAFRRNYGYLAVTELMQDMAAQKAVDLSHLEKIRAAFEMNPALLSTQVSAIVEGKK